MGENQITPIRILQILPGGKITGGIEHFVMNYYENIDRSKVQFDFLFNYNERVAFEDQIKKLGGRVYYFSVRQDGNLIKYNRQLSEFFQNHREYKVIHGHMPGLAIAYFEIAKKNGVKIRISHAHVTQTDPTIKGYILKLIIKNIKYFSNYYCACSKLAGHFMYGNTDFKVIPNAVSTERFSFSTKKRNKLRQQLSLENKFVVGNVGRYSIQKNQLFLLDIFNEVKRVNKNAILLLIGQGNLKSEIVEKINSLNLNKSVILMDNKKDIENYYSLMDVLVMPSLYEGLPLTMIEAQSNGLPCVVSDAITQESRINSNVTYISLNESLEIWASKILAAKRIDSEQAKSNIISAGYDIKYTAVELEHFYCNLYRMASE